MVAEGSVVFDQGDDQRITGTKGEFNYKTKLGYFVDSTGFTNQTNDGTVIYFTADRVERVGENEIVVTNGKFTACEEAVPKWSFTADEATIKTDDKVKLKNAKFRVKDVPLFPLPYASIPIKKTRPAIGLSDADLRFFAEQRLSVFGRVLSNARTLGGRHVSRRHLYRARLRLRRWTCGRVPIRVRILISDFTPSRTAFSARAKARKIPIRADRLFMPTAFIIFQTALPASPMSA